MSEEKDDEVYSLTPKGFLILQMNNLGVRLSDADELWCLFEGFCVRNNPDQDATYAALVFNGGGGDLIGVDLE